MEPLVPVMTTTLGARPSVAAALLAGLAGPSPLYERVGGVVRRRDNGRIVAWLRSTGDSALPPGVASRLGPLAQLSSVSGILSLSIAAMNVQALLAGIDRVERGLATIVEKVGELAAKIDLGYVANLRAACELLRNAATMSDDANRRPFMAQAASRFLEAQEYYGTLLSQALQQGSYASRSLLEAFLLACTGEVQCYTEIGEMPTARRRLGEHLAATRGYVGEVFEDHMTRRPALYLHPSAAPAISLSALTCLMRYRQPNMTETDLFESLRSDFWLAATQQPAVWLADFPRWMWLEADAAEEITDRRMRREQEAFQAKLLGELPQAFAFVEQAVELEGRLAGFTTELDFLAEAGIAMADWRALPQPRADGDFTLGVLLPVGSELCEEAVRATEQ